MHGFIHNVQDIKALGNSECCLQAVTICLEKSYRKAKNKYRPTYFPKNLDGIQYDFPTPGCDYTKDEVTFSHSILYFRIYTP